MDQANRMHYLPRVEAGEVARTLEALRTRHPGLGILVLLPEAEKDKVGVLQKVCGECNVPLAGAIFPALLKDGRFVTTGAWLLLFEAMPYAALFENIPVDQPEASGFAEKMAADIRRHIGDARDITLFLLFDAMTLHIGTVLDSLYLELANRVHYAGGNAGSESFQPMPCLFDGTRIIQNGVLAMLLPEHGGAVLEHGYRESETTYYATSTEGNRISQIDWRPAFEVYQELVRSQYDVQITKENFYQHAVHFPFGIVRANHHVVVRIPVMLADDGSIYCVGEVPPNSVLTLLVRPEVDSRQTLRILDQGIRAMTGTAPAGELLLLYCAGRRMHLGTEVATRELADFANLVGTSRIAGALSLGEIGSSTSRGYPLFHNATLVAMPW